MAITYPTTLDSLTNPSSTDTLDSPSHSDQHSDLNDAVEALETKVGADSSAVATSIDYKLTNTSSSNPGHKHTLVNGATDVTASKDEVNVLDGITASTAELNKTDGIGGDIVGTSDTQTLTNKTLSTGSDIDTNVDVIEVLKKVYPVGAIYISITSTSPNTVFGFGTWSAFGAGRVLVGYNSGDADFNSSEETGGSKTINLAHDHTVDSHTHSDGSYLAEVYASGTVLAIHRSTGANFTSDVKATVSFSADTTSGRGLGAHVTGTSGSATPGTDSSLSSTQSIVQPYITVFMFKRTA